MKFSAYIHESNLLNRKLHIKARVTHGKICMGDLVKKLTYITFEQVFIDGEYIEDIVKDEENIDIDLGVITEIKSIFSNQNKCVEYGMSFEGIISMEQSYIFDLKDWIISG